MNNPAAQNIVVTLIVAAAASYVLRAFLGFWKAFRAGAGGEMACGSCGKCEASSKNAVTIDFTRPT